MAQSEKKTKAAPAKKSSKPRLYPIKCTLTSREHSREVEIVKLTHTALLIDSKDKPLKVNTAYTAKFTVSGETIETLVIVFKTYDAFKGKHGLAAPGRHLSEVIFKDLTSATRHLLAKALAVIANEKI